MQIERALRTAPTHWSWTNLLKRSRVQVQLNMSAAETEVFCQRIRSHSSDVQLMLLAVDIKMTHLTPRLANQQLASKVSLLDDLFKNVKARCNVSHPGNGSQDEKSSTSANQIMKIVGNVLSDATALHEQSTLGKESTNSRIVGKGGSRLTSELREPESTSNSETNLHEDVGSAKPAPPPYMSDQSDGDDESDSDTVVELAHTTIRLGTDAMQKGRYPAAKKFFKEGLVTLEQDATSAAASPRKQWTLQYQMAVCTFHTASAAKAVPKLLPITEQQTTTVEQQVDLFTAFHLLAISYVRLQKLDLALEACQQALQGRRRLLGKSHEAYSESLALTSRIMKLQGRDTRARVYMELIPEEHKAVSHRFLDSILGAANGLEDQGRVKVVNGKRYVRSWLSEIIFDLDHNHNHNEGQAKYDGENGDKTGIFPTPRLGGYVFELRYNMAGLNEFDAATSSRCLDFETPGMTFTGYRYAVASSDSLPAASTSIPAAAGSSFEKKKKIDKKGSYTAVTLAKYRSANPYGFLEEMRMHVERCKQALEPLCDEANESVAETEPLVMNISTINRKRG
ncbi:Putative tetratricopeptide-like helical domain superfamily [Septoria linicola]|uniref:Tetratricopeptide-like helical domain superfamily n=1 Tax=Septoria linicola TaxID=215465 RepID=A0A9Q9AKV1_9PEZI|nr:Putative tetratricopeptide-like helical domain superfamily [Septoria linicola]